MVAGQADRLDGGGGGVGDRLRDKTWFSQVLGAATFRGRPWWHSASDDDCACAQPPKAKGLLTAAVPSSSPVRGAETCLCSPLMA